MAIAAADLRFKLDFHLEGTSKYVNVTDLIGSVGGGYAGLVPAVTAVSVLLWITSPTATLYINPGYTTDDYVAPDFEDVTPVWIKTGILISSYLNTIASGDYTINFKIQYTEGGVIDKTLSTSKIYTFKATQPVVTTDYEISCISSQIEFTDTTSSYNIADYYGNTKIPIVTSRSWLIIYPSSILSNITETIANFVIGYGTNYNGGVEIYRGTYKYSLTTTLQYEMEDWSVLIATNWITIYFAPTNNDIFEVSCPDCSCKYYNCLISLEESKEQYRIDGNQQQVAILEKKIEKLNWYWTLYNLSIRCGKDGSAYCEKIASIASTVAECCDDTAPSVNKVTAWVAGIGGGGSTGGMNWYFRNTSHYPTPVEGDVEQFVAPVGGGFVEGAVYQYTAGVWAYKGNMKGSAGTGYTPVLHNDPIINLSAAAAGVQTLDSYTVIAGEMATDGDIVFTETVMSIAAGVEMTLYIDWARTTVLTYYIFPMVATVLRISIEISRAGAASQIITPRIWINGLPDTVVTQDLQAGAAVLANANDIEINVDKVLAGAAADVSSRNFKVLKYNA